MIIEYNKDEMYEKYKLTDEQIKACKKVFSAIRAAGKLGVEFFDYYGTITAYNGEIFRGFEMEHEVRNSTENLIYMNKKAKNDLLYYEMLKNFGAGCADDDILLILKEEYENT